MSYLAVLSVITLFCDPKPCSLRRGASTISSSLPGSSTRNQDSMIKVYNLSGILGLSAHRIDHHSLRLDKLGGWRVEFRSVNRDPPLAAWKECSEVHCEQDIWEGIDHGKLACIVIGEQWRQQGVRLFCLLIYPNSLVKRETHDRRWRPGWNRRGVVVLEKRISPGESVACLKMPFKSSEKDLEDFDML